MKRKSADRLHNLIVFLVLTTLMIVGYQNCASMQAPESYQAKAFHSETPTSDRKKSEMSIYLPDSIVVEPRDAKRSPASYSPYNEDEEDSPRASYQNFKTFKK